MLSFALSKIKISCQGNETEREQASLSSDHHEEQKRKDEKRRRGNVFIEAVEGSWETTPLVSIKTPSRSVRTSVNLVSVLLTPTASLALIPPQFRSLPSFRRRCSKRLNEISGVALVVHDDNRHIQSQDGKEFLRSPTGGMKRRRHGNGFNPVDGGNNCFICPSDGEERLGLINAILSSCSERCLVSANEFKKAIEVIERAD